MKAEDDYGHSFTSDLIEFIVKLSFTLFCIFVLPIMFIAIIAALAT